MGNAVNTNSSPATNVTANSVALGTDTTGNYVATVAGTANEVEVSGSGSETAAVTIGLPNSVTITTNLTTPQLTLNGTAVTAINDEDNMSSNSATALATQQSIKAYVDAEVGAVDVTTSLAGDSGTGTVSTSQTLTINGTSGEVETSVSNQTFTIGLPNTVNVTTAVDVPTIEATNLKARDGTAAITIANSTGAVETASNLTVQGNLIVNGSTTQVDSQAVTIEDQLIELGMVNGAAPTSDLNRDVGVIFNWHDGSNAFKAGVYFDDSTGRIVAAKKVSESGGVLTNNEGAGFESAEYYISGCTGTQRIFGCSSGEIILENTTIDAGAF